MLTITDAIVPLPENPGLAPHDPGRPPTNRAEREEWERNETYRRNNEILAARGHINPPDIRPPAPPPPRTSIQDAALQAEMRAGQEALKRHAARAQRTVVVKSQREIASEGTNTPVFRPADFREYAPQMRAPAQTVSKDQGGAQGPLIVGAPDGSAHEAVYVPTPGWPR